MKPEIYKLFILEERMPRQSAKEKCSLRYDFIPNMKVDVCISPNRTLPPAYQN